MKSITIALTLLLILTATTVTADSPPYDDAVVLGLELSGELLAPPALVSQIDQDLTAIRTTFPYITDIHVKADWMPGELIVGMTEVAFAEYVAGNFTELDSLNSEYGGVETRRWEFIEAIKLEFSEPYHPEVLDAIYELVDGVRYAEPNAIIGDGNDISSEETGYYLFKRGWGDCMMGCTYNAYWEFSVAGGVAMLVAAYGNETAAMESLPDGVLAVLEQNIPNPFNPNTMIRYRLNQDSWVRLQIHDVRGRLIRELQNEFITSGEHLVPWNATDDSGNTVASGIYFTCLIVDGFTQTGKMILMK